MPGMSEVQTGPEKKSKLKIVRKKIIKKNISSLKIVITYLVQLSW